MNCKKCDSELIKSEPDGVMCNNSDCVNYRLIL